MKPWRSLLVFHTSLSLLAGCGATVGGDMEQTSPSLPEEPAVWEDFTPTADSTWGDLFRHFDSEGFSALPENIQAEMDQTLLTEQSPQFVIKEDGKWVFKWQNGTGDR